MDSLKDLDIYLKKIQSHILCLGCRRNCERKWFPVNVVSKLCLFCRNFNRETDTVQTIMKQVEWFFIKSGEDQFKSFYCEYARESSSWFLAGSKQNKSLYEIDQMDM